MKSGGFLKRTTTLQSNTRLKSSSKRIAKSRPAKEGLWSEKEADSKMSNFVIARDGRCLRCQSTYDLTNSHFHGRAISATRYDAENCDTLCKWCHTHWEIMKQPGQEYYEWKVNQIGELHFIYLEAKAKTYYSRTQSIKDCMELLGSSPPRVMGEIII